MTLKSCPICNGNNTQIDEMTYWTGMTSQTLSFNLKHWCDPQEDSFVTGFFTARGRTEEQVSSFWNKRVA